MPVRNECIERPDIPRYIRLLIAGFLVCLFTMGYSQGNYSGNRNIGQSYTRSLHHIIMYGQSLMLGTSSVPVITATEKYNTMMFAGGVRSGYDTSENAFYNGFLPLVEKEVISKYTGSRLGETPASGFSEAMIGLLIRENHWTFGHPADNNFQLLISSPAQGSSSVEDLSVGTYWERFKKDVTEGYRLALAAGMLYDVPVILWNQGERDIDMHTSPEAYKASIRAFRSKADQFIRSVTGQKNSVRLIMYQVSSHNVRKSQGNPSIANAQYELAETEPFMTISNATYQLPYAPDNVHFSNMASKWNGACHGVAAKRIIVDKVDWRPVFVERSSFRKNLIALYFHVPCPPLVVDTSAVSNPGHYGFRVWDAEGNEVEIKEVTIEKRKKVKIAVAKKVKTGFYVWYGNNGLSTGPQTGARGNLRDSQGQTITLDINGFEKRLDNWCPIFRETL